MNALDTRGSLFVALALVATQLSACGGGSAMTPDTQISSPDAAAPFDAGSASSRTDVTFTSGDGTNLTGYIAAGAAAPSGAPGVLLIHQFQRDDEQWGDLPEALVAAGFRVLAFNLRGHGDSGPYDGELAGILSDAVAAPADVDAALAFLVGEGAADPARIAVVGTSIGANLAVAAAVRGLARTYVSFSSRRSAAENYAGEAVANVSSVYYFAGENDSGDQERDARAMYDVTGEPRALKVYEGTADHGIAILANHDDARALLLDWLATAL